MSREGEFFLAKEQMEAARKFCEIAVHSFERRLDCGTPEQIERKRVETIAAFESWLDALSLTYWKYFDANGIDPDRRHLWKRPAR